MTLNEAMAYLRDNYGEEDIINEATYHYADFLYSIYKLMGGKEDGTKPKATKGS